jgi:hypothetical protein
VLAAQLSATECAVVPETPAPLTTIVAGEFVALLATFRLPLTIPAALGANVTFMVALCPAASVAPLTPPLVVIPVPLIVIPDIVTLEFPVFFRVTGKVLELPTLVFPKPKLVGVAVIVLAVVTPVPLIVSVNDLSVALLAIDTLPATYPVVVGV